MTDKKPQPGSKEWKRKHGVASMTMLPAAWWTEGRLDAPYRVVWHRVDEEGDMARNVPEALMVEAFGKDSDWHMRVDVRLTTSEEETEPVLLDGTVRFTGELPLTEWRRLDPWDLVEAVVENWASEPIAIPEEAKVPTARRNQRRRGPADLDLAAVADASRRGGRKGVMAEFFVKERQAAEYVRRAREANHDTKYRRPKKES